MCSGRLWDVSDLVTNAIVCCPKEATSGARKKALRAVLPTTRTVLRIKGLKQLYAVRLQVPSDYGNFSAGGVVMMVV